MTGDELLARLKLLGFIPREQMTDITLNRDRIAKHYVGKQYADGRIISVNAHTGMLWLNKGYKTNASASNQTIFDYIMGFENDQ